MTAGPADGSAEESSWLLSAGKRLRPDGARRRTYGWAAAGLFLVVAVASAAELPPLDLHWPWIAAAVALVLVTIGLVAAEYRLAGWILAREIGWAEALRITILSSAANLLPVPGGVVVRTEALRRKGAVWTAALGSNVVLGLGWLGVALVLAGGLVRGEAAVELVLGFLAAGGGAVVAMVVALRGIVQEKGVLRPAVLILLLEGTYVAMSAARLYAVLAGLGIAVTYGQAVTLAVAAALAAAVGVFPAGIGLRELLAGALSPLVGLAAAVGAFAGVVDRIVSVTVRGLLAVWLWRTERTVEE